MKRLSSQGGTMMVLKIMKIWTLFEKEKQVEDMDSPQKGITCQRHEPSSDKGEAS